MHQAKVKILWTLHSVSVYESGKQTNKQTKQGGSSCILLNTIIYCRFVDQNTHRCHSRTIKNPECERGVRCYYCIITPNRCHVVEQACLLLAK